MEPRLAWRVATRAGTAEAAEHTIDAATGAPLRTVELGPGANRIR
jgi:hypothetical protein